MSNNVLLDIDNTLTKMTNILDKMSALTGKPVVDSRDIKSYTIGKSYGLTSEQDRKFWSLYGYEMIENAIPNDKTIESIFQNIIKPDDNIYVITARPIEQQYITYKWLQEYGIPYSHVILCGKNSKIGFIERHDINLIVDDNPKMFEELEVAKDVVPKSNIGKHFKDGTMIRYVVDYAYNKDSKGEYTIDHKTGLITERK